MNHAGEMLPAERAEAARASSGRARVSTPKSTALRVLRQQAPGKRVYNNFIGRVASSLWCVDLGASVMDLIEDLETRPEVVAVGALNAEGRAEGLIVREEFIAFIGTQFGRSISHFKQVRDLMKKVRSFRNDQNTLHVAGEIQEAIGSPARSYFLLEEGAGGAFAGIFSNIDVMIQLSSMTQMDLRFAGQVIDALVKKETLLRGDGWDFLAASRPAQGLGGDYYHVRRCGGDRLVVALCDVCGKGVPASLVTSFIAGMFQRMDESAPLEDFVEDLNRNLHDHFGAERFVTGIFLEFDAATGEARYIDAGHGFFYLMRQRRVWLLKTRTHEIPLGIRPEMDLHGYRLRLERGDLLVFATDGIVEQKNHSGAELGLGELFYDLAEKTRFDAETLVRVRGDFFKRVDDFRGEVPQMDDMTLLLLHTAGESP
jgi:hypothetical protein